MGRLLRSCTKSCKEPATEALTSKNLPGQRVAFGERTNDNNLMAPQRKRKPCVYKDDGNTAESLPLRPEDRLAVYTFEVDKNEPKPKKKRRGRPRKKKLNSSYSSEDDLPLAMIKRGVAKRNQAKRPKLQEKKICNKENTGAHNLQEKNQRRCSTKSSNILKRENKENITSRRKVTEEGELNKSCRSSGVSRDPSMNKGNYSTQNRNSFEDVSKDELLGDDNKENDSSQNVRQSQRSSRMSEICQRPSVDNKENSSVNRVKPSIESDPDKSMDNKSRDGSHSFAVPLRKPRVCQDLTVDSELNLSAIESGSEHSSPVQFHHGNFVTQRARKCKPAPPATKTSEEFTVENYFGFDEESEDDLNLSLSLVNNAPVVNPTRFLPFAVSSTPYLKTTDTKSSTQPVRIPLRVAGKQPSIRQFLMSPPPLSKPVAVGTLPGPSAPAQVSVASTTMAPLETTPSASVPKPTEEPSALFEAEDGPEEFFCKPPRKSYERPVKLHHRESHTDSESWSDEEVSRRKRTKRSKKSKKKEDKIVDKWAANVSAQFEEIDSFQLCCE